MECSVCYSDVGPFRTLSCTHAFCADCIKSWYLKGTGTGCPMCRRPIYFKGFHSVRDTWNEDSWDIKCNEVLNVAFDVKIEQAIEISQILHKKFQRAILDHLMDDLKEIEKMFRFLKFDGCSAEEIDYLLNETDCYFSDRHVGKYIWDNDPFNEKVPQQRAKGYHCLKWKWK